MVLPAQMELQSFAGGIQVNQYGEWYELTLRATSKESANYKEAQPALSTMTKRTCFALLRASCILRGAANYRITDMTTDMTTEEAPEMPDQADQKPHPSLGQDAGERVDLRRETTTTEK